MFSVDASPPPATAAYTSPTGGVDADKMALLKSAQEKLQRLSQTDDQLRAARHGEADRAALDAQGGHDSAQYIRAAFDRFASRQLLGTRPLDGAYSYLTFAEVWQRVDSLGWSLHPADDSPSTTRKVRIVQGTMVGLIGVSSVEWVVAHLALHQLGAVSVPLPTGSSDDDMAYMIQHADLEVLATTAINLPQIARILPTCPLVKHVVVLDGKPSDDIQLSVPSSDLQALIERGSEAAAKGFKITPPPAQSDTLRALIYTSGSTGEDRSHWQPLSQRTEQRTPGRLDEEETRGGAAAVRTSSAGERLGVDSRLCACFFSLQAGRRPPCTTSACGSPCSVARGAVFPTSAWRTCR